MEYVLEVSHLNKRYPGFSLEDVSFSLEAGQVMGFLGRNGAGKTTTLKSILGLVHPDGGTVRILGQSLDAPGVRAKVGYAAGGAAFYPRKTLEAIGKLTREFYPQWDERAGRDQAGPAAVGGHEGEIPAGPGPFPWGPAADSG